MTRTRAPAAGEERLPHTREPVIAVGARKVLTVTAGQDVQVAAGEGITLASGAKFRSSMDQYDYEVQIETAGDPADPLKPRCSSSKD